MKTISGDRTVKYLEAVVVSHLLPLVVVEDGRREDEGGVTEEPQEAALHREHTPWRLSGGSARRLPRCSAASPWRSRGRSLSSGCSSPWR